MRRNWNTVLESTSPKWTTTIIRRKQKKKKKAKEHQKERKIPRQKERQKDTSTTLPAMEQPFEWVKKLAFMDPNPLELFRP